MLTSPKMSYHCPDPPGSNERIRLDVNWLASKTVAFEWDGSAVQLSFREWSAVRYSFKLLFWSFLLGSWFVWLYMVLNFIFHHCESSFLLSVSVWSSCINRWQWCLPAFPTTHNIVTNTQLTQKNMQVTQWKTSCQHSPTTFIQTTLFFLHTNENKYPQLSTHRPFMRSKQPL